MSDNNLDNFTIARVISESKGSYEVKDEAGEYLAKITGKQMFQAQIREDYPAVGDLVAITKLDDRQAVIHRILPRHSVLKRKQGDKNRSGEKDKTQIIATNIDVAFVVESVDRDYNLNRFERYFTLIRSGGAVPAIILNKVDLLTKDELEQRKIELSNRFPDVEIIATSVESDEGLKQLKEHIDSDKVYCFLGSSGVGKSSLINKLLEKEAVETGDISLSSGRGKHTTTRRQMYFLANGGMVIDNPGIREVGLVSTEQDVNNFFDDIAHFASRCHYNDCSHIHEKDCAVILAVESGELSRDKYENYLNLKKESDYYEMTELEKREKDRQFGKFKKKVLKELKDF